MAERISASILAGGAARRFSGVLKSKILIENETIISRTIPVLRSIFDEIVIVTNNPQEFADFQGCMIVSDEIPDAGPLGGIHASLKAGHGDAVFVFAGDMPFLDKKVILKLIKAYRSAPCDVLVPSIGKYIEPLHSVYNISLAGKLEEYLHDNSDRSVRQFIKSLNVRYYKFKGTEAVRRAFTNINTPSDILKAGRHNKGTVS